MNTPDLCAWCGEADCERSCTAALAAAVGKCQACGAAIMREDGAACAACGAPWPGEGCEEEPHAH